MPKKKAPLPAPKTQHRRKPTGRVGSRTRADKAVEADTGLRTRSKGSGRRTSTPRLARDAAAPLERYRVRAGGPSTGVPKKKMAPRQLKAKGRGAARKKKDAPRRG